MGNTKLTIAMASVATIGLLLVGCGANSASGGNAGQQNTGSTQTSTPSQNQQSSSPSTNNDSTTTTNNPAPSSGSTGTTGSSGTSNPSSGNSGSDQGTTSQPAPPQNQNQPGGWITVTSPQTGTAIKPGMAIQIAGKVAEHAFWNKTLHVSLASGTGATKQTNRLIHEQDFTISNDGTFQGTFQLPNSPFPANSGSSFQMVFQADYPHAPTYYVYLTPQN